MSDASVEVSHFGDFELPADTAVFAAMQKVRSLREAPRKTGKDVMKVQYGIMTIIIFCSLSFMLLLGIYFVLLLL